MHTVEQILHWPVDNAASAVVTATEVLDTCGDLSRPYRLASVTKLLTAYATLIAIEEGAVELDTPAGPAGATIKHLLAHTAGYEFDTLTTRFTPGDRRLYSNTGFEVLAQAITDATGIEFAQYAHEAVFAPLGMAATSLPGSPAAGGISSAHDLILFAQELLAPTLIDPITWDQATSVQFPGTDGILPGYGRQRPNDWGLGFEIRGAKDPHWTGPRANPKTFGHFGQSGTFLWVDRAADLACVTLTDRDFGRWAVDVWSTYNQDILDEFNV